MTLFYNAFLLPLLMAGVLVAALRLPATVFGLVDRPGGRKQHMGEIPLVGGIAIVLTFAAILPALDVSVPQLLPLMAGMALLLVCGLLDDLIEVNSTVKFGLQIIAALTIALWGGSQVISLGGLPDGSGALALGGFALPFTVLVVVGFVNAMNMIDGLDGLAGGVAVVILAWLAACAATIGDDRILVMVLALAAAVGGFLWFNMRHPWRRSATVFLGDAGSMPIGLALAYFAIELANTPHHPTTGVSLSPAAIAWILALPVVDTISVMARRMRSGLSPFTPGRDHLHHMLLRLGYRPGLVTSILMGLTAATGAIGVLGSRAGVPDVVLLAGLFALALAHSVGLCWARQVISRRLEAFSPEIANRGAG